MEQTESAKGEGFMAMNPVPTAERQSFLQRKNIVFSLHRYGIEALGAMALGLFSSLIVGLILKVIGEKTGLKFLVDFGLQAMAMMGIHTRALWQTVRKSGAGAEILEPSFRHSTPRRHATWQNNPRNRRRKP